MFYVASSVEQDCEDVLHSFSPFLINTKGKKRTRIKRTLKRNISKTNRTITDFHFHTTKLYYHNKATGGMIVKTSQTCNSFSNHERKYLGQS